MSVNRQELHFKKLSMLKKLSNDSGFSIMWLHDSISKCSDLYTMYSFCITSIDDVCTYLVLPNYLFIFNDCDYFECDIYTIVKV